jgi:hypothetical protein
MIPIGIDKGNTIKYSSDKAQALTRVINYINELDDYEKVNFVNLIGIYSQKRTFEFKNINQELIDDIKLICKSKYSFTQIPNSLKQIYLIVKDLYVHNDRTKYGLCYIEANMSHYFTPRIITDNYQNNLKWAKEQNQYHFFQNALGLGSNDIRNQLKECRSKNNDLETIIDPIINKLLKQLCTQTNSTEEIVRQIMERNFSKSTKNYNLEDSVNISGLNIKKNKIITLYNLHLDLLNNPKLNFEEKRHIIEQIEDVIDDIVTVSKEQQLLKNKLGFYFIKKCYIEKTFGQKVGLLISRICSIFVFSTNRLGYALGVILFTDNLMTPLYEYIASYIGYIMAITFVSVFLACLFAFIFFLIKQITIKILNNSIINDINKRKLKEQEQSEYETKKLYKDLDGILNISSKKINLNSWLQDIMVSLIIIYIVGQTMILSYLFDFLTKPLLKYISDITLQVLIESLVDDAIGCLFSLPVSFCGFYIHQLINEKKQNAIYKRIAKLKHDEIIKLIVNYKNLLNDPESTKKTKRHLIKIINLLNKIIATNPTINDNHDKKENLKNRVLII